VVKKIVDDTIKVIYQLNHIKSKNHKILQTISLAPATIGASNPFKSFLNPFSFDVLALSERICVHDKSN